MRPDLLRIGGSRPGAERGLRMPWPTILECVPLPLIWNNICAFWSSWRFVIVFGWLLQDVLAVFLLWQPKSNCIKHNFPLVRGLVVKHTAPDKPWPWASFHHALRRWISPIHLISSNITLRVGEVDDFFTGTWSHVVSMNASKCACTLIKIRCRAVHLDILLIVFQIWAGSPWYKKGYCSDWSNWIRSFPFRLTHCAVY